MSKPETEPQHEFDAFRDTYSNEIDKSVSFSGQSQDFYTEVKAGYILDILEQELKNSGNQPANVLDIGCGHGLIHPYLINQQRVPMHITGVDVAASVIDLARTNNAGVTYDTYDGTILPYADNSFSFAYAICVMHHVPPAQWSGFLREMKRVVKPGGLVAIFEHNPLNPLTRKIVNNCPLDENAVLLQASFLKKLFQKIGLTRTEKKFILFTPFNNKFFRKLDKKAGWLPLGAQYYILGRVI